MTDEEYETAEKDMRSRYPNLARLASVIDIDWWPSLMRDADVDAIMIDDIWEGDRLTELESDLSKLFAAAEKEG